MAEVRSGSKDAQIRSQIIEDVSMVQAENKKLKLELDALRSRQQKTEVLMRDLRDELMQSSEDIRKSFILNEQVNILAYKLIDLSLYVHNDRRRFFHLNFMCLSENS
jgi:ABC-type phosphate transport system auxiliary subunit